ncbi:DUF4268 domain-containing protein [Candidatus Latescibacterota bacterium]
MNLTGVEREKSAGSFSVDLVAEDNSGNPVIIENQLEKSDHDHLGKLITYLTAIGAKTAIWIVANPRPEHINAITWLNESSSASFYLLKVEAIKIGDSEPAPLLTLIVEPSEEGRKVGDTKKELAERHILRRRFWTQLLDYAKTKTKLHANISPSNYNWIGTGAGCQGLGYDYSITQHESAIELYIDKGKESREQNKDIFDKLYKNKEEIENVFGNPLDWQRLDDRRACRIKYVITKGGYRDDEKIWPKIHEALVDAMIRLEKALKPYINKLPT